MGDKISFSLEELRFDHVAETYSDTERCIRFYYTAPSISTRDQKFIGYSAEEVQQEQNLRLDELDKNSVFSLLAAIEASFRIDFYLRCYGRKKDDISRFFRSIYLQKGDKISLEEDILESWKSHLPTAKSSLSDLKGAFRYRHWLAHGRYWTPKLGQKYDFLSIYLLAQEIEQNFQLLSLK
jgi:hypothetical protein